MYPVPFAPETIVLLMGVILVGLLVLFASIKLITFIIKFIFVLIAKVVLGIFDIIWELGRLLGGQSIRLGRVKAIKLKGGESQ